MPLLRHPKPAGNAGSGQAPISTGLLCDQTEAARRRRQRPARPSPPTAKANNGKAAGRGTGLVDKPGL